MFYKIFVFAYRQFSNHDSSLSSGCLKELNAKLSHTQAILNETIKFILEL